MIYGFIILGDLCVSQNVCHSAHVSYILTGFCFLGFGCFAFCFSFLTLLSVCLIWPIQVGLFLFYYLLDACWFPNESKQERM